VDDQTRLSVPLVRHGALAGLYPRGNCLTDTDGPQSEVVGGGRPRRRGRSQLMTPCASARFSKPIVLRDCAPLTSLDEARAFLATLSPEQVTPGSLICAHSPGSRPPHWQATGRREGKERTHESLPNCGLDISATRAPPIDAARAGRRRPRMKSLRC
jgi:hypothetical protein